MKQVIWFLCFLLPSLHLFVKCDPQEFYYPPQLSNIVCQLLVEFCEVDLQSRSYGRQLIASCGKTSDSLLTFECRFDDNDEPDDSTMYIYDYVSSLTFTKLSKPGQRDIDTSPMYLSGSVFCSFLEYGCYDIKGESVVDFQCEPEADDAEFVKYAKCELTNNIDITHYLVALNLNLE